MDTTDPLRLPAARAEELMLVDQLLSISGRTVSGADLARSGKRYRVIDRSLFVGQILQLVDAFVTERVRQAEQSMARIMDTREREAFQEGQDRTLSSLASLADLVDGVVLSVSGGEDNIALRALSRRIDSVFKTYGYSRIETVGRNFDSRMHEVVEERQQQGMAPHTIIEEVSRGYAKEGYVLVVAKVIVAA